jgi:hypothetical protein
VYLTGPYDGAPFGLSVVVDAKAGPFNLGNVVVRAGIAVNPITAQATVTTGAFPQIRDGVPFRIKTVNVLANRPGFVLNPTNCDKESVTGQLAGTQGTIADVSSPFAVEGCAGLAFKPTLTVSTKGKASKADGASLSFKIAYPKNPVGSESWLSEVKLDIPKQLPARLTTIQKACLAAVFEANPASCPAASDIGHAIVHTPVLSTPLQGPVYFVSHGGQKFPEAVIVLQGQGVTIDSHGETFIKKGVTSATFRGIPDVPVENIEVIVPSGPFSEFGANLPAKAPYDFCGHKLTMPTLFKAQNGTEIHQTTPIHITGCPAAKKQHKQKRRQVKKASRR